jgi:hypothetical protein
MPCAAGASLSTSVSLLFEFGSRLGEEIACHLANLAQSFAVENHTPLDDRLGCWPQNAPDRLNDGRSEQYRTDPHRQTCRKIAFEHVLNQDWCCRDLCWKLMARSPVG